MALDQEGTTVDTWSLENAWISNANLGEYDYGSDDLMGVDITVKYDFAKYNSKAGKALNRLSSPGTGATAEANQG